MCTRPRKKLYEELITAGDQTCDSFEIKLKLQELVPEYTPAFSRFLVDIERQIQPLARQEKR